MGGTKGVLRQQASWKEALRASIIIGCKLAKCWGRREKGGERGETGCKLMAGFGTRTKEPYEKDKWAMY